MFKVKLLIAMFRVLLENQERKDQMAPKELLVTTVKMETTEKTVNREKRDTSSAIQ